MAEYTLVHVGINCENSEEALKNAALFEALFGLKVKEGNTSVFAGTAVELNKAPGRGKHGHIGIGTPDVEEAMAELTAKGFRFDPASAKRRPDGTLNAIYLSDEICGFAVHLMRTSK